MRACIWANSCPRSALSVPSSEPAVGVSCLVGSVPASPLRGLFSAGTTSRSYRMSRKSYARMAFRGIGDRIQEYEG